MPSKTSIKLDRLTRPPLERMHRIFVRIKEGDFPNRTRMARELEVTSKTIQRDIDFMRDRLDMPIEYNPIKFGYYFTEPVSSFGAVQISQAELIALFVAQKALVQYRGTPFERPLRSAFEKLTSNLSGTVSVSWSELDSAISFRTMETKPADLHLFQELTLAVEENQEVVFDYKKLNTSLYQARRVQPYHVACIASQWYLFGFDLQRKKLRTFVLPRMRGLQTTGTKFKKPKEFSLNKMLRDSFGVFEGKHPYQVNIRFDAFAAQLIRERIWHRSQKIKELPNHELELHLKLDSFIEIEQWILSWGQHAKVLEPSDLIQKLRQTLQMLESQYK